MHLAAHAIPTLVLTALLPALASAQGNVPPLVHVVTNPHPSLSSPTVPGSAVDQVHMVPLPGAAPGIYLCGLTVVGLSSMYGAAGRADLLCGTYDAGTDTFTPNNDAAALNTPDYEFGLTFHPSGLYCTWDNYTRPASVWLGARANLNSPFQVVGQINLSGQPYWDPVLADYQGRTHLLYVLGTDIVMQPIDVTTAQLSGTPIVIVNGVNGGTANSPSPFVDSNGEILGLSHHNLIGNDNDHFFSADLDPTTPALETYDTPTWTNNGALAGSRWFDAEYTPSPYHVLSLDVTWTTGTRAAIGTTAEIRAYAPTNGTTIPVGAFLIAGTRFLPNPIALPGIRGMLGVDLTQSLTLPMGQYTSDVSTLNVAVPNVNSLRGTTIPCQVLTIDSTSGFSLGNTARLAVD